MLYLERTIDSAPVERVYARWLRLEDFPRFMKGFRRVRRRDTRFIECWVHIVGHESTWRLWIDEQLPCRRMTWHSVQGMLNAGCVRFRALDAHTTRVHLHMAYRPERLMERVAGVIGVARADGLHRFKRVVEAEETDDAAVERASEDSFPASDPPRGHLEGRE